MVTIREERVLRERLVLAQARSIARAVNDYDIRHEFKVRCAGLSMWEDTDEAHSMNRAIMVQVALAEDALYAEITDECLSAYFGPESVEKRKRKRAAHTKESRGKVIPFPNDRSGSDSA